MLLVTGASKLVSAAGSANILYTIDPIFKIPFQDLFVIVGVIELTVCLVCLLGSRIGLQIGLAAWLATNFLMYRIILFKIGWHKPCECLGNLTGAIHIQPKTADIIMRVVLVYIFCGSYAAVFYLWKQRLKAASLSKLDDAKSTIA